MHTGFIGTWQPEDGLNKHTHIHKHEISTGVLSLQIISEIRLAMTG